MLSIPQVRKITCILAAALAFVVIGSQYFSVFETHTPTNILFESVNDRQAPKPNPMLEKGSPRMILIVGYMHTGSSYLADLFQQSPQTFYLYEPLNALKMKVLRNESIMYLNGTEMHMTEETYKHAGAESVVDMFSCNYSNLDIATLTDQYGPDRVTLRSGQLKGYARCLEKQCNRVHEGGNPKIYTTRGLCGGKYFTNAQDTHQAIVACLKIIDNECTLAKTRILKMIRMSMDMTELALNTFPNMQIIHLLRDPRAMLDSNHRHGEMGVNVLSQYQERTEHICGRMTSDVRIAEQLKVLYPGRIFTLRYEDMVDDPTGIAKNVYDFAQVPFTKSAKDFVRRISIDSRRNSTVRATAWRSHIDQTHLNIFKKPCQDLFQMLGYAKLASIKDVRNMAIADHK